jgi:hypothetical protein
VLNTRSRKRLGVRIAMLRTTMLGFMVGQAAGWATKSQTVYGAQIEEIQLLMNGSQVDRQYQAQLGYLWHQPEDITDSRGLGGGITWAWASDLCEALNPVFREDIFGVGFVGCDDYRAAVARAFDKWAANNRNIKFLDVTEECDSLGMLEGPPFYADQEGMPHGGCPLAEIWVTQIDPDARRRRERRRLQTASSGDISGDAEEESALSGSTAVATALPHARIVTDFRYTSGERPFYNEDNPDIAYGKYSRGVVETYAGTFSFNADYDSDICWYLDTSFCSPFHELKTTMGSATNAKYFTYGLTFGLMAVGVLFYICLLCGVCLRVTGVDEDHIDDEDGDGKITCGERAVGGFRVISHWNPIILTIFVLLLIVPPLITGKIFYPCFDCYDFEAAALHEIGHFLGLGHHDNIPNNWLAPSSYGGAGSLELAAPVPGEDSYNWLIAESVLNGVRPNTSLLCKNPWKYVEAGYPLVTPEEDLQEGGGGYMIRNAQMEARTQNNPIPCLTNDDLEGLTTLYPDCGEYALYQNVCHKVQINVGWVRIGVYILIPGIITLLGVVLLNSIVHGFEKRETERFKEKAKKHAEEAKKHKVTNAFQRASLKAARKSRDGHKATAAAATMQMNYPSSSPDQV